MNKYNILMYCTHPGDGCAISIVEALDEDLLSLTGYEMMKKLEDKFSWEMKRSGFKIEIRKIQELK